MNKVGCLLLILTSSSLILSGCHNEPSPIEKVERYCVELNTIKDKLVRKQQFNECVKSCDEAEALSLNKEENMHMQKLCARAKLTGDVDINKKRPARDWLGVMP